MSSEDLATIKAAIAGTSNEALKGAFKIFTTGVAREIGAAKRAEHLEKIRPEYYSDRSLGAVKALRTISDAVKRELDEDAATVLKLIPMSSEKFSVNLAMKSTIRMIVGLYETENKVMDRIIQEKEKEEGDASLASLRARAAAVEGRPAPSPLSLAQRLENYHKPGGKRRTKKRKQSKRKRRHTRK